MSRVAELGRDARNVIADGRHAIEPTPGVRERVRRRVSIQLGAGSAVLLASRASFAKAATWSLAAAVTGAAVSATVYVATIAKHHPAVESPAASAALIVTGSVSSHATLEATSNGAETPRPPPSAEDVETRPIGTVSPTVRRAESSPPKGSTAPSLVRGRDLNAQIELLAQANAHLNRGDPAHAGQLLAEYDRRFGAGLLGEERALAQILWLCGTSNVAQAKSAAARFEKRWPHSPLLARVERSCAKGH